MQLIQPKAELITLVDPTIVMKHLETVGRTCYKSADRITDDSYESFLRGIIDRRHDAMLEHFSITIKFTVDRGVTHEMVRHRIASFAQTSTRYVNYSKDKFGNEIQVIQPFYFDPLEPKQQVLLPSFADYGFNLTPTYCDMNSFDVWMLSCLMSEWGYMTLTTQFNRSAQESRTVLPQSTMAEIYVTANFREWMHICNLRAIGTTGAPHPDMKYVMKSALDQLKMTYPIIFGKLGE